MSENINLGYLFQAITKELTNNQQSLNQADAYNQNHGDNMVRTFRTITKAVKTKQKQGGTDSAALAYAAKRLSKSSASGSAQLYAQGLSRAAGQLQGKPIDQRSALQLLQSLISGGQPAAKIEPDAQERSLLGSLLGGLAGGSGQSGEPAQGGDLMSGLLGGLMGGGERQPQPAEASLGGGLLGSLLGGLGGSSAPQSQDAETGQGGGILGTLLGGLTGGSGSGSGSEPKDGFGLDDLLSLVMAFMRNKGQSKNSIEALVQAFTQGSGMGSSNDRTQSTQLVVSSFLQALGIAD